MARITLNANTALTSAALALPDNARIVIIDTDTEEETADLTINGAESLIITGQDAQITTVTDGAGADNTDDADDETFVDAVIAAMLDTLGVNPRDIDTHLDAVHNSENAADNDSNTDSDDIDADNVAADTAIAAEDVDTDDDNADEDDAVAIAVLTAIRDNRSVDHSYTIRITYDNTSNTYTDTTTNTEVPESAVIDIINRASETNAGVSMRFNIPTHGVTTFTGDLIAGYNGRDGIALVGHNGGAYVLGAEQELTDDMSVLEEAKFTFVGDADMLFADLDVEIIDIDEYEGRTTDTVTNADDEDEDDDTDTYAAPQRGRVRTFDADEQLYVSIYSRSHDLNNTDIRRIVNYATTHDLSARLIVLGMDEPYVGRLQARDKDADNGIYTFVDKKFGAVEIDLNDADGDPGFSVLEIYSDTDMRRRGFAGTNHTDYTEISVVEMAKHIDTALDV